MKRLHDPSLLHSSSSNISGKTHIQMDRHKKNFVNEWISNLPEPMHRHRKCARKNTEEIQKNNVHPPSPNAVSRKFFNQMEFVSLIYDTKVENLESAADSESFGEVVLSENMLNLTLGNVDTDEVECSDSESSWTSTEWESEVQICTLVEYPPEVVVTGGTFKELPIDDVINRDAPFKIIIFEVVKPLRFWFTTNELCKTLTEKFREMQHFYDKLNADELRMAHSHIFPRQICVVPFIVGWARGIIQSYLMGSKVRVLLVDYGMEVKVLPNVFKYLRTEFMELPRLVMRGCLAYIKPKSRESWPSAAKRIVNSLLFRKKHMAKFVELKNVSGKNIVHLEVFASNSETNISKLLVEKGYAEYKEKYV